MVRRPAVAGHFYRATGTTLKKEVESLLPPLVKKEDAIGVISPHAGYIYSGAVAGSVLGAITPKKRYIILGPNHTGLGGKFSVSGAKTWTTPLGDIPVDQELAEAALKASHHLKTDDLAHAHEHSIEVQLPFLQVIQREFTILPIILAHAGVDTYREIGSALAEAVKGLNMENEVAIIASSDMTHYEPHQTAKKKDSEAIDAILALDEARLMEVIENKGISMCGYAPVSVMLAASKALGAKSARLVKYQTSGDTSGDYSSVVGYSGIIIM
jgi:AmmeMemoRadiSam system protein B